MTGGDAQHGGEVLHRIEGSTPGSVKPLEWDDNRLRRDPHENLKDLTSPVSITRDSVETVQPAMLLVCVDCRTYYEYDEDWTVCPQCGEGLTEVKKA